MVNNFVSEISSYFQHEDYSLAIRRLLDVCLDINKPALIQKAIDLSKIYHRTVKDKQETSTEFLNAAKELIQQISSETITSPSPELLVSVEEVSKTYTNGNFTLSPISFRVSTGDILGVVGENGNGKTTLLRCLAGQLAIDTGSVHHTQVKEPGYYAIKHQVAFIPQRIPRWYGLLKDNLHFSAAIADVHDEENDLMVNFMLERLGLSAYANYTWNQISSGYRTRFEIARVLLQKPSLLILDEPLANLDINAQQTILTDLRFMAKSIKHPMGVVLSSQQLHEVEKIADNVLFIKRGSCMFQTKEKTEAVKSYILELETVTGRDDLIRVLGDKDINIQFNGGFYTITSASSSAQEMLNKLVSSDVSITYFRDITYSTKRFFN
ncbi:MAG TPA: ABC transporter ATP-binding protein [Chitinophagaceae bacterium]